MGSLRADTGGRDRHIIQRLSARAGSAQQPDYEPATDMPISATSCRVMKTGQTLQTVYRQVVSGGSPKLFKHGRVLSYGPDRELSAPPPLHMTKYYKPAADDSDQ